MNNRATPDMPDFDPPRPSRPAWSGTLSRRRLLALAGSAAAFAACGNDSSTPSSTQGDTTTSAAPTSAPPTTSTSVPVRATAASTTTEAPTTTTPPPPPVQPLTGLPLTDPALLSQVAVVVKISNDKGARPQTGLNGADIVFEAWGAGPTRFAAVWHSTDTEFVGPIRSCREQDVNLVGEFNRAVFACSGGNPGNIALLRDSDLLLVTESQGPGWRLDPNRNRPHKTHADTAGLRSNAGPDRTAPAQQFHYRGLGEPATAGDPASGCDLEIQQISVSWRFDPASGSYLRAQQGGPHRLTDAPQVTTENVIVAWLDYYPSSTDGRSPDGRSIGTNNATVFTGGRVVNGTWSRNDRLEPFAFTDGSGAPILLTPGRTFIELANTGAGGYPGTDVLTPLP